MGQECQDPGQQRAGFITPTRAGLQSGSLPSLLLPLGAQPVLPQCWVMATLVLFDALKASLLNGVRELCGLPGGEAVLGVFH